MSILFIGDPHFKLDNILETNNFVIALDNLLVTRSKDVDYIVVLGDILHNHEKLHTQCLNQAMDFFKMLLRHRPVYCLVGNHDAINNSIFLTEDHWLNILKGWSNITIVDKVHLLQINKSNIILCPYVPDGRLIEALGTLETDFKKVDLVVCHQLLDGVKMGPIVANNVEKWDDSFPFCISGHIHDKQRPQPNLFYVGSALQIAFGESSDKIIFIYNVETKEEEEIDLGLSRKEILYINIEDLDKLECKINKKDDTQLKIVIKGDASECKSLKNSALIKELSKKHNIKNIQFKETKQEKKPKTEEKSFELLLRNKIISKNDPYLLSLADHLLIGGDDISDKDVFII